MKKARVLKADLSQDLFEEFTSSPEVAVDCEMMGLNPVRDRLCLVQIAADKGGCGIVQVDEQAGAPLLKRLMEDSRVTKIFHYARMDCLYMQMRLGIRVQNAFCTKIASKLGRTYTDKHGLKELVREFTGTTMDKSSQSSDWGKNDLSDEQVRYAEEDVRHLFALKKALLEILEREGRLDIFNKCLQFLPVRIEMDSLQYPDVFEH